MSDSKTMSEYHVDLFDRIDHVKPTAYLGLNVDEAPLFQHPSFLRVQEEILRDRGLRFHYAVISRRQIACGFVIFQEKTLSTSELIGNVPLVGRLVSDWLNFPMIKLLICGDLLSTGISGACFEPNCSIAEKSAMMQLAADRVAKQYNRSFGMLILKDVASGAVDRLELIKRGYVDLKIAPTMYLQIAENWRGLDDYSRALKNKYRHAVDATRKAAKPVSRRLLDVNAIAQYQNEIDTLYRAVYKKARYIGPHLDGRYFYLLRKQLSDSQYFFTGYFLDTELIGFSSRYFVDAVVESAFYGLREDLDSQFQLQKNMMLDDLEFAIEKRAKALHMGRTNYEIKSAIGARPRTMPTYFKPLNTLSSPFIQLARCTAEVEHWERRNPFRAEVDFQLAK